MNEEPNECPTPRIANPTLVGNPTCAASPWTMLSHTQRVCAPPLPPGLSGPPVRASLASTQTCPLYPDTLLSPDCSYIHLPSPDCSPPLTVRSFPLIGWHGLLNEGTAPRLCYHVVIPSAWSTRVGLPLHQPISYASSRAPMRARAFRSIALNAPLLPACCMRAAVGMQTDRSHL
jgi:hypothetical protein